MKEETSKKEQPVAPAGDEVLEEGQQAVAPKESADFYDGKNAAPPPNGQLDPVSEAARVAEKLAGSTRSAIEGYEHVADAVKRFGERENREFTRELVKTRVLPADEADLGLSGSRQSMMVGVGTHAEMLTNEAVLSFFKEPRLTPLYQTTVLYELIPGHDEHDRIAELVKILRKKKGAITREFLLDQTRERKRAQKSAKTNPSRAAPASAFASPTSGSSASQPGSRDIREITDPSRSSALRIPGRLPGCMRAPLVHVAPA